MGFGMEQGFWLVLDLRRLRPIPDVSGTLPWCPWKFSNHDEASGPVHQHPLAPCGLTQDVTAGGDK